MIQRLADQFAGRIAKSSFGLANAIRSGSLHYERRRLTLRNDPPFNFYTCSTATKMLIEHLRKHGVSDQDLFALDLSIPLSTGDPNMMNTQVQHMVPLLKQGQGAAFFQLTPLDNLLADTLPDFVQQCTIDILQGDRIDKKIDSPGNLELLIQASSAEQYQFVSQMLSASLSNSLLTTAYLGLTQGQNGELLVAYVADCLKRNGSEISLTNLGELGFIIGLDLYSAQQIGHSLIGNAGDYASFLPWLAADHERTATFLEQRYCAASHPEAASLTQQILTDNLPVFGRFLSLLPPAIFKARG